MILNKMSLVALGGTLIVAGCTTNPYTGERETSNAVKVGAGAAAVCALVGATESSKRARNAALGCGLIGAGVGAYMDVQEKKLREQLQGTGVQVQREGDQIRLIMPSNITFQSDSYSLNSGFEDTLASVATVLAQYADTSLRVAGHTDSTGEASYNQKLSEERAQTVADFLSAQGVAASRLFVEGLGENQPIADNSSASGRASNRRVELTIIPKAT